MSWEQVIETLMNMVRVTGHIASHQHATFESLYEFIKLDTQGNYLSTIPYIAKWALDAQQLFPQHLPLKVMSQGINAIVSLTREQVRSLLALMFWCAIPSRQQPLLPQNFTLSKVFGVPKSIYVQVGKIFCFFSYFQSAFEVDPRETIEFRRVCFDVDICSDMPLPAVSFNDQEGAIVENYPSAVQVDFADKSFCGGVLHRGSAQEECMMLAYVEPIVGMLFVEQLLDSEVVYVSGVRVHNYYSGFGESFVWRGRAEQSRCDGRVLVAMDASDFRKNHFAQFSSQSIMRELNKAILGFSQSQTHSSVKVITGNWGCGVFQGNFQLKFLIQWMAAAFSQREIVYLTWRKPDLQYAAHYINYFRNVSAMRLLQAVMQAEPYAQTQGFDLFGFCQRMLAQG